MGIIDIVYLKSVIITLIVNELHVTKGKLKHLLGITAFRQTSNNLILIIKKNKKKLISSLYVMRSDDFLIKFTNKH